MKSSLQTMIDRGVRILDKPPAGWIKLKGATTAPVGYTWFYNGESLFGGNRQRVLVKNEEVSNGKSRTARDGALTEAGTEPD